MSDPRSGDPDFHRRYYAPPPPPPLPSPVATETAGLINAAKWGVWTWIALVVLPILLVVGCCGLCVFGGVIGAATTPTPTP